MSLPAEKVAFTGLTSSDFAAAAGVNPYQSRAQLWRLLTGREVFEGNALTRYGQDNEHRAIAAYEAWSGELVEDCGDNQRFHSIGLLGCTIDGRIGPKRILECKCPAAMYEDVRPYHLPQIQGSMLLHFATECDYIAWTLEETRIWRVEWSEAYTAWMEPLLREFLDCLRNDLEPKRLSRRPVPPIVQSQRLA